MSRAEKFSEKGNAQKEILPKQIEFFPSVSLGDAEILYSLSRKWRTINETLWGRLPTLFCCVALLLRFSFFLLDSLQKKGKIICQKHKKLF